MITKMDVFGVNLEDGHIWGVATDFNKYRCEVIGNPW